MTLTDTPGHHLDDLEQRLEEALRLVRNTPRTDLTAIRWLETAAKLGDLLAGVREASAEIRQELLGGARTALLAYLRQHVGETVPAHELEGVSGIREWARRVRELRAMGWAIDCLGAGQEAPYCLSDDHLDETVALSDELISGIKGAKPRERLIEYLLHLSPWPVAASQLERVAGVPTWRDDLRALVREGWLIQSRDDDPSIPPGFYRLARIEDLPG
ncbi:hypothetical protein [Micromonospora chersina]|uniref:hypothetical protein n=1 Tax=Micromonospora chersina TaxID=47854 RepID=UPI0037114E49